MKNVILSRAISPRQLQAVNQFHLKHSTRSIQRTFKIKAQSQLVDDVVSDGQDYRVGWLGNVVDACYLSGI